jgi:hypothetical protein
MIGIFDTRTFGNAILSQNYNNTSIIQLTKYKIIFTVKCNDIFQRDSKNNNFMDVILLYIMYMSILVSTFNINGLI